MNPCLGQRDAEWAGSVYNCLRRTVQCISKYEPHSSERRAAYCRDITYGTNNKLSLDYLCANDGARTTRAGATTPDDLLYFGVDKKGESDAPLAKHLISERDV